MKAFKTKKFYMGFPVFIISMINESRELFVTTMSSSYSLGDKLVIGMSREGHTAKQIKIGTRLAANYLSDKDQICSDISGFVSSRRRIELLNKQGAHFSLFDDVPYMNESLISVIAKVTQIVTDEHYLHLFLTIENRLIDNENLNFENFNPLLYVGDEKMRYYKKTTHDALKSGSMLQQVKKMNKK